MAQKVPPILLMRQCESYGFVGLCAMFEGLTEFCFVFRFGFHASLLALTSQIERLDVCYYCADAWSVLAHYCSDTVAHVHWQAGQVIASVCMSQFSWLDRPPISCLRSPVAVAAPARLRLVARCALVLKSLQTSCLQWVMTRYHSQDTMLEIGARK